MSKDKVRTLDIVPRDGEVIKPVEFIGMSEMSSWSLYEMRVFDALLRNAWDKNLENPNAEFTIRLSELRGLHDSNDRIRPALETLQRSLVRAKLSNGKTRTVQYLGATDMEDEEREHGFLTYDFHRKLIPLLRKSEIYARMEEKVLGAFTSKYAYALYQEISKRINLRKTTEEISLVELRGWLSVENGKLETWNNLNQSALKVALREVNALSPYQVEIAPKKQGRKIASVLVSWSKKNPYSDAEQDAAQEVNRVKVGRRARITGTVEHVTNDSHGKPTLTDQQIQKGYDAAASICRIDKNAAYRQWQEHVKTFKRPLDNPVGHWISYCKRFAEDAR